jgi:glutathione S-transferase
MLTVYGRKSSFNLQKVMWLIGELGLVHKHIELGGAYGGLDTPEFRAMNPHGRVPSSTITERSSGNRMQILRYLAACYNYGQFWSEDAAQRSLSDRWMDWSQSTLQPDFLNGVFWAYYRTPAPQRDMAAVDEKVRRCGQHFLLIDSILAGRQFLLGQQLSLADIAIGTSLYRYFNIDIARPALPNVERWYSALQSRPAYRAHVMVPFDELRGGTRKTCESGSQRLDDLFRHLLGVAEQHHGVVAIEQRVVDPGVAGGQRALGKHHRAGLPYFQNRHAVDR